MADEFYSEDEHTSTPKNSFWGGSTSASDTADLHFYDSDDGQDVDDAAADTDAAESIEQEPNDQSPSEAETEESALPPWLGLTRQVSSAPEDDRSGALETARRASFDDDRVIVRAPVDSWEDGREPLTRDEISGSESEDEGIQENAPATGDVMVSVEPETTSDPAASAMPESAPLDSASDVTSGPVTPQATEELPTAPYEERMIPAGTERIDVDGDYRLEPANRVGDDGLGDVMYIPTPDSTEGEEKTSFLSGPPVGLSKRGSRIRIALVVSAVVITLVALYGMGVNRFSDRYLPNTSIYGCNVAGMDADEAQHALENETKTYRCALQVDDFGLTVTGSDIGLERDEAQLVQDTFGTQSPYMWPIAIVAPTTLMPNQDLSFDEDELSSIVSRAVDSYNGSALSSSAASIQYNEESASYELVGSVSGQAVDNDVVNEAVLEDVKNMHTQCNVDAEQVFRTAQLTDLPSYRDAVEHANAVRTNNIDILVNGEAVATSEAAQNAEWVSIGDGPRVEVYEDGVRAWAEDVVADATYHTDEWNAYYLDTDTFVSQFCERLASGRIDGYEAPMIDERTREGLSRDSAYEHTSWNSELGRYIDVDLTSQFARLFDENGEVLWESAIVTGDLLEDHSTVEGIFNIYSKELGVVLVGLDYDNDGNPDYESYVNYWMPFYGGYGLHDATWRWAFGGDLYQYDGSHGCVNLPYEKARDLFEITYVGEVVNVHW